MWMIPIIAVGGLAIYGFYPGLMSPDALFQYAQVKSGQISNLHPPMMAWIWRGTDQMMEGPGGLYLLYMGIYLLASASIAQHLFRSWYKRASCFSLLLLPPLTAVLMTVWKDSLLLATLMMSVAAILSLQRTQEWRWFWLAIGSLFLAATLRHNALPALLPLLFILLHHTPQLTYSASRCMAKAIIVLAMFAGAMPLIEKQSGITRIDMLPTVAAWDMAAISVAENQMLLPSYMLGWQGMTSERLSQLFSPVSNVPLCQYTPGVGREVLCMEAIPLRRGNGLKPEDVSQLTKDWIALIRSHTDSYLDHRMNVALHLLGFYQHDSILGFNVSSAQPDMLNGQWYSGPNAEALSIEPFPAPSARGQFLAYGFQLMRLQTPLMDPWLYLCLLAISTGAFVFAQHGNPLRATALALCTSGWLMLLPLFFIAPNPQLRYAVWPIACAILTTLMLRRNRRRSLTARQRVEQQLRSQTSA